MRNLIINLAIAVAMTSLFSAMVGTQIGIAIGAARAGSDAPLADTRAPVGPKAAVPGTHDQRAS
jgi:hypothetical protein